MDYQSRRQVQGEATRLAILDAAIRLTRQVGFDKMTIRDICTAAGVTTGAFYHHFSSKEDLVAHAFSSLDGYMEKALAPYRSEPAAQQLDRLLRLYARYMEDMGWQTMAFYYIRRLSDPQTNVVSPNRYTLRTMERCLEELHREGAMAPSLDPRQTADFFYRHFRGVVIDWVLHRGEYSLWDKLEQDYHLFQHTFRI